MSFVAHFLNLNTGIYIPPSHTKDNNMKLLKKIAVAVVMTASMLVVSSNVFAAEVSNAAVAAAAKTTEAKLLEAKSLLEKGGDANTTEQIQNALNEARQSVKEFRYEPTERSRQKLNDKLKLARDAFLKNDNEKALAEVEAALVIYTDIKKIYDAGH